MDRLRERARFTMPQESKDQAQVIREMASPVGTFLDEHCRSDPFPKDPDRPVRVDKDILYAVFRSWASERGHDHIPTLPVFSQQVYAARPRIKNIHARTPTGRRWIFSGIRFWTDEELSAAAEDTTGDQ